MPYTQPGHGDVHQNRPLTNISIAYLQSEMDFVASRVFQRIPVPMKSDQYYVYDRGDFNRDEMQERAMGTESAGGSYNLSRESYNCVPYGFHQDVPDQLRGNADSPLMPDRDATNLVTRKGLIRRERAFSAVAMVDTAWTVDADGAAARSANFDPTGANNDLIYWNRANSTPIEDVRLMCQYVQQRSGFRPNVLTLGRPVWNVLLDHDDIIGRLDRGQTSGPAIAMRDSVAALLELDEILVMDGIYNSADEGATENSQFIGGKDALLTYRPPTPGVLQPAAGYMFDWTGYAGTVENGVEIRSFYMNELESTRIEGKMAFDFKVTSTDLGAFLDDIVE